ncbi:MAG: phosphoglycerate dehydrogenase [Nitrospinaceae bacterium]
MTESRPRIAVTPPAFCRSHLLKTELGQVFPNSVFNEKDRYLSESELIDIFHDADAAVVGRDPINEKVLSALPRLKFISKYGVGLDNIDQEALPKHRVGLGWTPGVNKRSVAELTVCFILGLFHNVFSGGYALRKNIWIKDGGSQLSGKTVGIIGCGNVGAEVVRLLVPFDCRILVRDLLDKSGFCREHGAEEAGFDELVERSDIISLHVPLTGLTREMFDENIFRRMKSSAFLINTSRGEIVAQPALKAALIDKSIAGAALDVFSQEPPEDPEFLALPNLMATPHIGGNAAQAVEAMGRSAIAHLVEFFNSPDPDGKVAGGFRE